MKSIFFTFFIVIVLSASALGQENKELDVIINKVQAKYEKINEFHAKFTQESTVKALDQVQEAEGEVWLKKPGKMRWNYYEPTKEEYVSDGSTLWFYNHEEKQIIESTLQDVTDTNTATTFLSGLGDIEEQFNPRFSNGSLSNDNNYYMIDLIPIGDDEGYNKVTIAVDKESMLVRNFYLYDPFGNLTKVELQDIEINKGIPDSLFTLKVPKGTELIKVPSKPNQQ
ncbi:MAG TPA: outer membrane lipoprotein chaperone LolA [Thermodesulfobacteriota bacterium]|nr:outer membrane lipoprotein chaperone LolA [Thermodesulfobacteriota bacterium]